MANSNQATAETGEPILEQVRRAGVDPLSGVPEELQIHLGDALDWIENRTEAFDGGVRLAIDTETAELREWSIQDLTSCFDVEEPEAEPYREAITALALLLKIREDLRSIEDGGDTIEEEDLEEFRGHSRLIATVLERIQRAIDASVLRGSLVGARNLSRMRELVGAYRQSSGLTLEEMEKRRREARRKNLTGTGKEFSPAAPAPTRKTAARRRRRTKPATQPQKKIKKAPNLRPYTEPLRFPWAFSAMIVLAIVYWGLNLQAESSMTHEPSLDSAAWERILPLEDTFTAGGILYATIAREEWGQLPYRDRLDRFTRLHQRAELAGFDAVILTDESGDFAAQWSEGSLAQIWNR